MKQGTIAKRNVPLNTNNSKFKDNTMKRSVNIWMQLLGFDKNDADRGVGRFLERTGFVPESICALLFHPDFVHHHKGMDKEYTLYPDNCAYRAVLRNTERYRQDWTNYELRELTENLAKRGIKLYAGIMGSYLEDRFHREWLSEHQEIRRCSVSGRRSLMCLKRLADGSYYEDFFIKKLVETLVDYGFAGVHLADSFCPVDIVYKSDYSTDMIGQFTDRTGIELPKEIADTLGDDSREAAIVRQKYIWGTLRQEWIAFYEWRWERFFKKLCDAVHAVGKEVWILGMYCTDPFETRYIYGFDTKKVIDAGVDCITANILPTSVYYERPELKYYFHRMHMDVPLLRAQVGEKAKILTMVGIHDASEEWSMIDHAPVKVERDAYTALSFSARTNGETIPASDGVFFCLGDGVERSKWDFIMKRVNVGACMEFDKTLSPVVLWSDTAHSAMLGEYIKTRRASPHKQSFEIFKAGAAIGGAVRSELLTSDKLSEILFVPNFDMLSSEEQSALKAYKYPWVATAPTDFESVGISFTDTHSDYPMTVFARNIELSAEDIERLNALALEDDGRESRGEEPETAIIPTFDEIPTRKLSSGFLSVCAELLNMAVDQSAGLCCNYPMMIQRLADNTERLYIYNKYDNGYATAVVDSKTPIDSADIASDFPVLPVKFVDTEDTSGYFDYEKASKSRKCFQVKLAPDGVTVVDIKRSGK